MVHLTPGNPAESGPPQPAKPVVAAAPAAAESANDFDSIAELGLDQAPEPPEQSPSPGPTAAPAAEPAESPDRLSAAPAESLGRKLAIGIGSGGAVLVTTGLLLFALTRETTETAQAEAADPSAHPPSATTAQEEPANPVEAAPPVPQAALPEREVVIVQKAAVREEAPQQPADPADSLPELPDLPQAGAPPLPHPTAAPDQTPDRERPVQAKPGPMIDPLDFDPASLDLVMLRNPSKEQPEGGGPSGAPLDAAPREKTIPGGDRLASLDRRLASLAKDQRLWIERDATAFEQHTPVVLARRLSDTVPELFLPKATLPYAVRVWSDLSGAPVTIDPAALAQAGVGLDTRITLNGRDEPLSEVLLAGLKPVRLGFDEQNGHLALTRRNAAKQRNRSYDLSDLLPTEAADASIMADLARRFVLSEEHEAGLSVDGKKLRLQAPAAAHFDLIIFCERLRRARGLKPHTRYPSGLLSVSPSLADLSPALGRGTTFSFVTPTPLSDVVSHWRRESGIEILVDWASLATAKLGPRSLVKCSARETTWREALDGLLAPLGLAWRPVSGQSLQITTAQQALDGFQSVEFYQLRRTARGQQTADSIAGLASAQQLTAEVVYDSSAAALIVRASGVGQRSVFAWLVEHGAAE